jgi:hypothetical protein
LKVHRFDWRPKTCKYFDFSRTQVCTGHLLLRSPTLPALSLVPQILEWTAKRLRACLISLPTLVLAYFRQIEVLLFRKAFQQPVSAVYPSTPYKPDLQSAVAF